MLAQELRKRKTPQKKIAIIRQTIEPGVRVSHVARLNGIQISSALSGRNSACKAV